MDDNNTNPTQDQGISDQAALLAYVEQMIKDSGDPAQDTQENKQELLKAVNDEINRHLVDLLSEADQEELNTLLDREASDEELNNFFSSKVPNIDEEIAAVLLNFRAMYLNPVSGEDTEQEITEPTALDPAPTEDTPSNQ